MGHGGVDRKHIVIKRFDMNLIVVYIKIWTMKHGGAGCREVVKDKVNGFLVPFKDEDALFTAVMDLLRDSSLRHKMGVMGRKMIMENFTQEKVTSETMRVCDNLLK